MTKLTTLQKRKLGPHTTQFPLKRFDKTTLANLYEARKHIEMTNQKKIYGSSTKLLSDYIYKIVCMCPQNNRGIDVKVFFHSLFSIFLFITYHQKKPRGLESKSKNKTIKELKNRTFIKTHRAAIDLCIKIEGTLETEDKLWLNDEYLTLIRKSKESLMDAFGIVDAYIEYDKIINSKFNETQKLVEIRGIKNTINFIKLNYDILTELGYNTNENSLNYFIKEVSKTRE